MEFKAELCGQFKHANSAMVSIPDGCFFGKAIVEASEGSG
jgi:hypothetical protein